MQTILYHCIFQNSLLLNPDTVERKEGLQKAAQHLDTKNDPAPPSKGRERRRIEVQEVFVFQTFWKHPAEISYESKVIFLWILWDFLFFIIIINENLSQLWRQNLPFCASSAPVFLSISHGYWVCSAGHVVFIATPACFVPWEPWARDGQNLSSALQTIPFQIHLSFYCCCFVLVTI